MTNPNHSSDDLDLGETIRGITAGMVLFGRFTTKRILGRGGMGVVWLAHDDKLKMDVALKFMPEIVSADPTAIEDLRKETRNGLQLSHPNLVGMLDFIEDGPTAAIVMEFVDGKTLNELRREQPDHLFEPHILKPWLHQLLDALEYAHTGPKMIHRDLKPHNLMITTEDQLKLADFGIASCIKDSASRVSIQANTAGTLPYMSPQQLMGEIPTFANDIYSLGATLYDLLTGRPPFYTGDLAKQIETKRPPTISQRRTEFGHASTGIPQSWEDLIASCLEKDPLDRPKNMAEIRKALEGQTFLRAHGGTHTRSQNPATTSPTQTIHPSPTASDNTWKTAAVLVIGGIIAWQFFGSQNNQPSQPTTATGKPKFDAKARAKENFDLLNDQLNSILQDEVHQPSVKYILTKLEDLQTRAIGIVDPSQEFSSSFQAKISKHIQRLQRWITDEQRLYDENIKELSDAINQAKTICEKDDLGAGKKSQLWQQVLDVWTNEATTTDYGTKHIDLRELVKTEALKWQTAADKEMVAGELTEKSIWSGSPISVWDKHGRDQRLLQVKSLLHDQGIYMDQTKLTSAEIDAALQDAIVQFQQQKDLPKTGRLDAITLKSLNIDQAVEPQKPAPAIVQKSSSSGSSSSRPAASRPAAAPASKEPSGFEKTMMIMSVLSQFR
jgi:serine/threonine protein kinase